MTALPGSSQTLPATICTPRAQAAKNADSIRVLPTVREKLAGARLEVQGLEQKLSLSQGQLYDARADIRGLKTDNAGLKEMVLATKAEADGWHIKARRRGWGIGIGIGLPLTYGGYKLFRALR
ncbi:hypothetical protein [Hymenobacter sediminicola]|uniref:Uncharacterized protein n=1 Tax=Hymenobacter sediminicola TaxID=2761579 RepID=A0A7G7W319_9BACT|nr:hypothetical protein [Hymenobacter sediminicola]QNH60762.1 hypothetical protein H4317_11225 [Hymenobacter sediminicola]